MRTVFEVRLGAQVIATGTRGTLYFDDFESRRFSYIGTLPDPGLPVPEPPSQPGWDATNYTYDPNHVHAAITAGANTYTYDANGNTPALAPGASVTCRVEDGVTYKQIYNSENRLSTVQLVMSGTCASPTTIPSQWDFVYDGDGNRVKQTYTDFTTSPYTVTISSYFMGGLYEVTDGTAVKKYYSISGMTVAVSDGSSMTYLLTDHLGSVSAVTDASGALLSQQRYLPFGQERADLGPVTQTDFGYTGQRNIDEIGLMDYHARMYDSLLGRFVQPDSIVPGASPQAFNRYSYVFNDPIGLSDPSGHGGHCRDDWSNYKCGKQLANQEGPSSNPIPQKLSIPMEGGIECLYYSCGSNIVSNIGNGSNADGLDFTDYSDWEKNALLILYNTGQTDAVHGVEYMLSHDIHIAIASSSDWRSAFGSRGAWFDENTVFLPAGTDKNALAKWDLQNIIHEALHIEQGPDVAHSWYGEMEAWHTGYRVLEQGLHGTLTLPRDINAMMTNDPSTFGWGVVRDDPGYGIPMILAYPENPGGIPLALSPFFTLLPSY